MDINFLQSFVSVVECGSLAGASRLLDLTPAAIAARIKSLEDDVGVPLVKRAGRFVKATEAGEKILERSRAIVRDVRDLKAVASDGTALGELRLGVFISALASVLPPALKGMYDKHPRLKVFVMPGSSVHLCREVASGALDAAIVVEPQSAVGKACEWVTLVEEPLVVVARQEFAGHDPHALLASQPFIRYDRSVVGGQLADRYLRDHAIRPDQRLEMDSLMAIATLVGEGLGVALLPDWAPMWQGSLGIVRIPLPGEAPVRRVGLVWAVRGPRATLARAFMEEARRAFGSPGPAGKSAARKRR